MNLIERVTAIVLKPRETWPVIADEPASVAGLYKEYIALLAAVPAVAGFIGTSVIGMGGIVSYRVPLLSGLVTLVVGYLLSLAMVYVVSLIVDALAPKFGGQRNSLAALKVVAYGATAGFLGGIFSLLPALSLLGLVAGLYSIYLLYTGLPVLMKCPPERALPYTAVVIVCAIVASILVGAVTAMFTPRPAGLSLGGLGGRDSADVTIKVPGTGISVNTAELEAAARRVEAAQARGDERAAAEATSAMVGAAIGAMTGQNVDTAGAALPLEQLRGFLPAALAGLPRTAVSSEGQSAMGVVIHEAQASYGEGDRRIEVTLTDHSGIGRVAAGAWVQRTLDREDADEVERVYRQGARGFHEQWRKDGSGAELRVALENGVQLRLDGVGVGIEELRASVGALGADRIAAVKRQP